MSYQKPEPAVGRGLRSDIDDPFTDPLPTTTPDQPALTEAADVEKTNADLARRRAGTQQTGNEASTMSGKAQDKASEMSSKASELSDKAQAKADEMSGKAQAKADEGMDKAAEGLGHAADTLRQQGQQRGGTMATAATKTADTLDTASHYLREKDSDQLLNDLESLVRRKPVESMLVAAGVGFVFSKLFR